MFAPNAFVISMIIIYGYNLRIVKDLSPDHWTEYCLQYNSLCDLFPVRKMLINKNYT